MNILIISDLHIGNNDYFETFSWKPGDFIAAIEKIKYAENIKKVILNGDIFELYKYSFYEICSNNRQLVDYLLNSPDFVYIKGNHDAICPYGQNSLQIQNTNGQIIHIEHGHSADFLNGTRAGQKLQTLGFNLLRWMSKQKWILKTYQHIHEITESINKIPKKYDSIRYLSYALRLLKNYDMVVLGHTHKIETHKTYYLNNKKQYLNSGSCSMGRLQALVINTETLKHETLKFKNYKAFQKEYAQPMHIELAISA